MEEEVFQGRLQTIRLVSIAITCVLIVSYNEILQGNAGKNLASAAFLVVLAAVKFRRPSVGLVGISYITFYDIELRRHMDVGLQADPSKDQRRRIRTMVSRRGCHFRRRAETCLPSANRIHQFFIESNYLRLVQEAASAVLSSPRNIQFIAPGAGEPGEAFLPALPTRSPRSPGQLPRSELRTRQRPG